MHKSTETFFQLRKSKQVTVVCKSMGIQELLIANLAYC